MSVNPRFCLGHMAVCKTTVDFLHWNWSPPAQMYVYICFSWWTSEPSSPRISSCVENLSFFVGFWAILGSQWLATSQHPSQYMQLGFGLGPFGNHWFVWVTSSRLLGRYMICDLWNHIHVTLRETNILLTMEKGLKKEKSCSKVPICDRSRGSTSWSFGKPLIIGCSELVKFDRNVTILSDISYIPCVYIYIYVCHLILCRHTYKGDSSFCFDVKLWGTINMLQETTIHHRLEIYRRYHVFIYARYGRRIVLNGISSFMTLGGAGDWSGEIAQIRRFGWTIASEAYVTR